MNTMRRALARARRGERDRGSIPMLMLVIVVSAALGGLMLPMLITQDRTTRFDTSRVRALHAAQTGIEVAVAQFRASTTTDTNGVTRGDAGGLPCGTITGDPYGDGGALYRVTINYFLQDPARGAVRMPVCAPGYGPYDPASGSRTPRFARINSFGKDLGTGAQVSKGRTIITTYVFQTDDTNISGGIIRLFPNASGDQWCMDAGSATPAAGAAVVLRACSTSNPPLPQQVFAYRGDLSIQLVSSISSTNPSGLCLDTNASTHAVGTTIVLKQCAIADPTACASITSCSPWNQQWSVDDNAHLEGAKTDKSNIDGFCIDAAAQSDGIALTLQTCAGGVTDTRQTWVPAPTAGAGMAGPTNSQLVNYKLFATCLDVTGQNPNAAYLILYTCKQNPDPSKVAWNQKFAPSPALGTGPSQVLLTTTRSGTRYCLTSALTSGGYVRTTQPCPTSVGTAADQFKWTVSQILDASGAELPYAQKYTVVDAAGRCLAPGNSSDLHDGQYLKVVTSACDGSTGQKWNANASLDRAKLTNTHEN